MSDDRPDAELQRWYFRLLHLYPKGFRDRFAASMAQTFADLLAERRSRGQGRAALACAMMFETALGIVKERVVAMTEWRRQAVQAALASLFILCAPLFLTLSNPQARLNGGAGGGWDWASGSFLVMGVMLFGAGMAIQFAARKITRARHRLLAGSAIGLVFLIAWVELAVDGVSKALATLT